MEFTFEAAEAYGLMQFSGRMSAANFPHDIESALTKSIEDGRVNFILDLDKVEFVDSSGLSTLLTILTRSRNAGGEAILINIPENLSSLLIITKLNTIFTVKETLAEAEESFLITKT